MNTKQIIEEVIERLKCEYLKETESDWKAERFHISYQSASDTLIHIQKSNLENDKSREQKKNKQTKTQTE